MTIDAARQCERTLRDADPDRAVSLAFAPRPKRPHLAALYAFNVETARVRDAVSQPLPGEIRLQWWRDTILGENGVGASGHPVAQGLLAAIAAFDLPREAFDRLLEARIVDLYDDPMPDRVAFEAYAGATASAILMLAVMILDREAAPRLADAAGHAGVAQAAVGAVRSLSLHRARNQIVFPADLLSAAGCAPQALLSGEAEPSARAVALMADFAEEHWRAFERHAASVPPATRAAFLPPALTPDYLRRIRRAGPGNLTRPVAIGPVARLTRYWTAMRG